MSEPALRWRTVVEIALISAVLYVILGAPGFPSWIVDLSSTQENVPIARAKPESLVFPDVDLQCTEHDFKINIFATSPLVIYIDGFVSQQEAQHLVDISAEKWQVSTVFNEGVETTDQAVRKSEKALIDRDETVQCIEQRALAIQGWPTDTFIERLWTQRYDVSGHYAHHYDWATGSRWSRRVSSFMVYLSANCTGGGTHFPHLQMPRDDKWCEFIDCNGSSDDGVTFRAKAGNAVFWMNFDADGKGYPETLHAGMPVSSGTKVGINIWSWYHYQAGQTTV